MGSREDLTGLLSLPPEIRDQIYTVILHPNNNRTYHLDEYTDYSYSDAFVLFRVNRRIYAEAREVFRRLNVFVRIQTPWPEAEYHIHEIGHVPVLMTGARAESFAGHNLQVTIDAPSAGEPGDSTHQLVILADDLPAFTKAWFYWNLSHAGLNQWLSLRLFLRDPYTPEWDEKHVRREVQRRLLLPFGDVKGMRDFSVTGDPKPQPRIAAELRALQDVAPASPEQCLTEGLRLKNEGNDLLRKGDARGALDVYSRAWEAIHIVVRGRQRHVHAEAFFARNLVGEPFDGKSGQLERMSLRLQLVANTCLAYLRLDNWEELHFWGMRTIRLMRQATGANDAPIPPEDEALLSFPSASHVGRIYYCTARACEALEDRIEACRLLRVAQVYLPRDQTIAKRLVSLTPSLG